MNFTEENMNEEKHKSRVSNVLIFLLLLAAVAAVVFLTFLKKQNFDFKDLNVNNLKTLITEKFSVRDKNNEETMVQEFNYEVKDHPVFALYKDYIIKCTRDSIMGLNKKGEEIWKIAASFEKPFAKTNGDVLLIADGDGKDIYVIDGKQIKWHEKMQDIIINADIGKSGHVTVIQEAKGYKCKIKVYDPLGIELFTKYIAQNYIIGAVVSPSGEQLLVNSINTEGVNIKPNLEFYNTDNGQPFSGKNYMENEIFASVWYLKDDTVVAAGSKLLLYLDRDRNEKWDMNFEKIYSVNTVLDKYVVAAVSTEKRTGFAAGVNTDIKVFDTKGHEISIYKINSEVKNIQTFGDLIGVNAVREVYFLNTKGKLIGKYTSKSDILSVYFFSKAQAVVVTKNSIAVVKIG